MTVDAETALTKDGFATVLREQLQSEISIWPARAHYPSQLAHPCDRYLVWRWTRWQDQQPHDTTLQSIFDHGRDHQPLAYRRLEQMGFEMVRESDRPVQYEPRPGVKISGRPDGRLIGFRGVRYRPSRILEIKSMSGYQWDQIETVDDLRNASAHYTRSYYAQGQFYSFMENTPLGVFVLMSKATGLMKIIPFELDYGYVEELIQRIERLQTLIERRTDPDPITFEWGVCKGCGFENLCYPAKSFGEGASVLDDAALLGDLQKREELAAAKREYDQADKAVKERLKHEGVKFALAGDFVIEGKIVPVKAYTVPAREDVRYTIRKSAGAVAEETA